MVGGKQLDGFAELICAELVAAGIPSECIFAQNRKELPGFFRATKRWDIIVAAFGHLLGAVELKSQVGSFGNNLNNRVEESVGNAYDFWTAARERAFGSDIRPWLGYFFLLQEKHGKGGSMSGVRVAEHHFQVFPEFRDASHAQRMEEACRRMVREGLYDATWFLLSAEDASFREPAPTLGADIFLDSLVANVHAKYVAAAELSGSRS